MTCDWVAKWFPALTGRRSLYTVQGYEWVKGEQFGSYVRSAYAPHRCLMDRDLACLNAAVDRVDYDYLYISKFPLVDCKALRAEECSSRFSGKYQHRSQFSDRL